MKDLINITTIHAVRTALINTRLNDKDENNESFLEGECFKNYVLFSANDLNMTVLEIIADLKKMNGIK